MGFKFKIVTTPTLAGDIYQTVIGADALGRYTDRISDEVIHTKDAQIRAALIKLGWTPPKEVSNG